MFVLCSGSVATARKLFPWAVESDESLFGGLDGLVGLALVKVHLQVVARGQLLEVAVAHAVLLERVEARGDVRDAVVEALRNCVQLDLSLAPRVQNPRVLRPLVEKHVLDVEQLREGAEELVTCVRQRVVLHGLLIVLDVELDLILVR